MARSRSSSAQAVRSLLLGYSWPGNVRELAAWIERLYVTGLSPEALVEMLLGEVELGAGPFSAGLTSLQQVERQAIVHALERSNFNRARRPACCRSIARRWHAS